MTRIVLNQTKRIDNDNIRYSGFVQHNGEEASFDCRYIISSNSAHIDAVGESNISAIGLDPNDVRNKIEWRKNVEVN